MRHSNENLRRHERVLVPPGHTIRAECNGSGPKLSGTVSVIGFGGLFVRTRHPQPPGTIFHVKLINSLVTFESQCTVRHVTDAGMGMEFTKISPTDAQKLKFLLVQFSS